MKKFSFFLFLLLFSCAWFPMGMTQQKADPCQRVPEYEAYYSHLSPFEAKVQATIDQAHACKNDWAECNSEVLGCQTIWLIDFIINQKKGE
jgi:hypothetical protein